VQFADCLYSVTGATAKLNRVRGAVTGWTPDSLLWDPHRRSEPLGTQYLKMHLDWVAAFAAMTAFGCFALSRENCFERHPGLGPGPSQATVARMMCMKVSTLQCTVTGLRPSPQRRSSLRHQSS